MHNELKEKMPEIARGESLRSVTFKPFKAAIGVSGLYFFLSIVYIYVSSRVAASSVLSKDQLEQIELFKGFLFVLVTAVLLFIILFLLFKHLRNKEKSIEKQRNAIIAAGNQASAGLFASSVAHDLNNILMVSQFAIDQLSESKKIGPSDKKHVDRLAETISQIRDFAARLSDVSGKQLLSGIHKIDVVSVVTVATKLAQTHSKLKRCSITRDLPENCYALMDESILHRSILNLLLNAADANKGRGQILVKLSEDDKNIQVEVHDEGPGISQEDWNRILEPFYTTKSDGSGLGLLSVRYCTEIHGGSVSFETSCLGGSCIRMVLPKRNS